MLTKRLCIIGLLLKTLVASSCSVLNFNGPIGSETFIQGINANESILVVHEDFLRKGNNLPKGEYYPLYETTGGYIVYQSENPLSVQVPIWGKDVCSGGIAIKIDSPETNYFISVQNCFGEPNLRINIPKELKFHIVERSK